MPPFSTDGRVVLAMRDYSAVRALVVGGTGFIGPEVVRQLVAGGCDVAVAHRGVHESDLPTAVKHVHCERRTLQADRDTFSSLDPDVVIDMRPMTEEDARHFVDAFTGVARQAVVVSSADVYRAYGRLNGTEPGPPDPVPLREDAPLRQRLYADRDAPPHDRAGDLDRYDKILVERVVSSEPRLPVSILRLGMVHGPRSYRHYAYIKRMADGRPGIVLADTWARWRGTLAYSENVAAAIALVALRREARGAYNVGDAAPTPTAELVASLAAASGWSGRIVTVPIADLPEPMRPGVDTAQELILDTSRIRDELGYSEPVPAAEGFRRTVEWATAHPPGPDQPMGRLRLDYGAEDDLLRTH